MTTTTTATGAFPMRGTRSEYRLFGALDGKSGLVVVGPATRVVKEGEALRFEDGTYIVRGDDLIAESTAAPAPCEITEEEWLPWARDWAEEKWRESSVESANDGLSRAAFVFFALACNERGIK